MLFLITTVGRAVLNVVKCKTRTHFCYCTK